MSTATPIERPVRRLEDDFEDICLQEAAGTRRSSAKLVGTPNTSDSSSVFSSRDSSSSVTSVDSADGGTPPPPKAMPAPPPVDHHHHHHHDQNYVYERTRRPTLHKKRSLPAAASRKVSSPSLQLDNLHQVPSKHAVAPFLRRATSTSRLPSHSSRSHGNGINSETRNHVTPNNRSNHVNAATTAGRRPPPGPAPPGGGQQSRAPRLTRRQIEHHFDRSYDEDDDLADDACIWNVPLSPALYAKSRSVSTPSTRPKSDSQPTLKCDTNTLSSIKETEPTQVFASPPLRELGEDAQILTEAFQSLPGAHQYDELMERKMRSRSAPVPSKRSLDSNSASASPSSATRPNWLPPKSPEEDRKHMREYQRLIEQTAVADKKKQERRLSEQQARKKQQARDEHEWTTRVLPHFQASLAQPKTRELWWSGVPPKLRNQVWSLRIGNRLGVTSSTFAECQTRAKASDPNLVATATAAANTAFPDLHIFQAETGPLHESLVEVLVGYAGYRPDIGYRDGLNNIAALFLLNVATPLDAFTALCNMLDGSLTAAMYVGDDKTVSSYYAQFLKVLHTKLPSLYQHFQNVRLAPSAYLEPLLIGWFSRHVTVDIATRLCDILIFEGDGFLLRAALGILATLEHKLYGSSEEILHEIGWTAGQLDVGEEDHFIAAVRNALKVDN
ncbi:hypothetical protein TRICI_003437 [Trichomonascus ciferrii]|uniref:Rab-GAP TBC domain-containing protein n=1 Tax=Trichomonascus ciferrii TaxID=44093 RepID=A0A642V3Y7_9ASCO|nr:hypothetical protein TRICI_003437 [Trichomonascus ciferrii]